MDSLAYNKPRNQLRRGVRVVGSIRPLLDSETDGSVGRAQLSVSRFEGEYALVHFDDQNTRCSRKDSWKLDWCYEQDEKVDHIFNREVKPLIEGLFCGKKACVIAYGARGSGKSQLIQGSEENPGLAMIAICDILAFANKVGGSVSVSCYEVSQEHIYDLLEPKEQEVLVLEDAARRIQLKGLSQVPVNTVSDFKKLWFHGCNPRKSCQNLFNESTIRSHRGLIVYLSFIDKESNTSLVGKINFINLADYEDSKQKGIVKPKLAESSKINKSLYTLLTIIYAINAGESFIPFRESKLTRLLQDFLSGTSMTVLITCLKPVPCPDTVSTVNLASRSCLLAIENQYPASKVIKSSSRLTQSYASSNVGILKLPMKKNDSSQCASSEKKGHGTPFMEKKRLCLEGKLASFGKTSRTFLICSIEHKENGYSSAVKERKLFGWASPINKSEDATGNCELVNSVYEESIKPKGDDCHISEQTTDGYTIAGSELDEKLTATTIDNSKGENQKLVVDENPSSPPISERLREISNSLKLLSTQTSCFETPKKLENISNFDYVTPQDVFRTRSTGLKKYLVQDCLAFLNSANKEELKGLKGIGEKRATYILELRKESPEPFKNLDDLRELGLSTKQINAMISQTLGDF